MKLRIDQSPTLDELIRGCVRQRERAQRALYERLAPTMYAVCLRYVRDADDAQDVLLRAFTRVFGKIKQYQQEGSFEGWVRRIVVNEALMFLRQQKNMHVAVDLEQATEVSTSPSSQLEADDLLQLVQELPLGFRTVFNLYCIEGYTHAGIAQQLNISEGTSKSQLSRAKALLRRTVAQHDRRGSAPHHDQLG